MCQVKTSVATQMTPQKPQIAKSPKTEQQENELAGLCAEVDHIRQLSGVSVIQKLGTRVIVSLDDLRELNVDCLLTIDFDPEKGVLTHASFSVNYIPHADLLEYGIRINNVSFIIHELQERLYKYKIQRMQLV